MITPVYSLPSSNRTRTRFPKDGTEVRTGQSDCVVYNTCVYNQYYDNIEIMSTSTPSVTLSTFALFAVESSARTIIISVIKINYNHSNLYTLIFLVHS